MKPVEGCRDVWPNTRRVGKSKPLSYFGGLIKISEGPLVSLNEVDVCCSCLPSILLPEGTAILPCHTPLVKLAVMVPHLSHHDVSSHRGDW